MKQKDYKEMKKQIGEETASGIGFFYGIEKQLPDYALVAACKEIALSGWIKPDTTDNDLYNMLVTESIKATSYQDFKSVAPYLFSYPAEQREKDKEVTPVEVSRDYYNQLIAQADELFHIKQETVSLENRLDQQIAQIETQVIPSGDEVLGVDVEDDQLLVMRNPEHSYIDDDLFHANERLLTDYRSSLHPDEQIVAHLLELENPKLTSLLHETVVDSYRQEWPDIDRISFTEDMIDLLDQEGKLPTNDYYQLNFDSLKSAYTYGSQSKAFQTKYSDYSDFIKDIVLDKEWAEGYDFDQLALDMAEEIVENRLSDINDLLRESHQELIIHRAFGYSQGEQWDLAYLSDLSTETKEGVIDFLEHEIGAYYRGSLVGLEVISLENIDIKAGFNGQVEMTSWIDSELLWNRGKLEAIKERFSDLKDFVPLEQLKNRDEDKDKAKEGSIDVEREM